MQIGLHREHEEQNDEYMGLCACLEHIFLWVAERPRLDVQRKAAAQSPDRQSCANNTCCARDACFDSQYEATHETCPNLRHRPRFDDGKHADQHQLS
jgi:hypothetical protein